MIYFYNMERLLSGLIVKCVVYSLLIPWTKIISKFDFKYLERAGPQETVDCMTKGSMQ